MIKETLKIFSQNVRKNKTLTDTILENNKDTTDIIITNGYLLDLWFEKRVLQESLSKV